MTTSECAEVFRIDEGWETPHVGPAEAAKVFGELGASGIAAWVPGAGTEVVVVLSRGRVAGAGVTSQELADAFARKTGAEVAWGTIAAGPGGGFVPAVGRESPPPAPRRRAVFVLPTTLEALGVDGALPTDPFHVAVHGRIAHVVLDGRSVLVSDEPGVWNWAPHVRPVIAVTMRAHEVWLEVFQPDGAWSGRKDRWLSASGDLVLAWCDVARFGDETLFTSEFLDYHNPAGSETQSDGPSLDRVLRELGRSESDAAVLAALSRESLSETVLSRLLHCLGVPAEAGELLRSGAPAGAATISLAHRWSLRWLLRRSDRCLVA